MTVLLAVFTDGRRECIAETIPSALANLKGLITSKVIFDDSGDTEYVRWLRETWPDFTVHPSAERLGFGGSIGRAWQVLAGSAFDEEFVLHLEDDFTFNRPVLLWQMAALLRDQPHLAQVALRRQPWNDEERAVGGVVEQHPDDYADRHEWVPRDSACGPDPFPCWWLEHRRFWTSNPSLYRRSLCERGWPTGAQSEGRFSAALFAEPAVRCAFWGARDSGEWVTHIGRERAGVGY